tara:strand:+ start:340 stop:1212 length:873 start_codon:yes stop_codon:yes gene_type:complete
MKYICALVALLLVSCAPPAVRDPAPHPLTPAAALLDCARVEDVTLVSAHRGGPADGVPDNSLAALRRSAALGAAFAEIDLRWTRDGEIVLMHDDTLERTTTGQGRVADHTLAELQTLQLRDGRGRTTGETVPSLQDAFAVSVETGILLQLDPKTLRPSDAARAAQAAGMVDRVVIITSSEAGAHAIQAVSRDIAISVPIQTEMDLMNSDLHLDGLVSWLSSGVPGGRIEAALTGLGIESSAHDFSAEARGQMNYADYDRAHVEVLAVDNVVAATRILGRAGDHCPASPQG